MHEVAEILARLYVKNRRYTVRSSGFCGISIIHYISDFFFEMSKFVRGFLCFEISQTENSFWGKHGVTKLI